MCNPQCNKSYQSEKAAAVCCRLPPDVSATHAMLAKASYQSEKGAAAALQIAIDVLHLSRLNVRSEVLSILVASQCLLLWLKIQYFAR